MTALFEYSGSLAFDKPLALLTRDFGFDPCQMRPQAVVPSSYNLAVGANKFVALNTRMKFYR